MTKLEKDYKKALEALKSISANEYGLSEYAAKVYAELTAKEYEVMKRFICPKCEKVYGWQEDCCGVETVDFSYSRPVEEKEEVLTLIVKGNYSNNRGVVFLPKEWCGEEVEIRRLKGE